MAATIPKNEQDAMNFLAMLRVQWPKRFESEESEDQWLDLMISELKQFPQPVLEMACKSLMRKKLRGFPLLGECVEACVEAKRFLEVKHPELKTPEQKEAEGKDRAGHYWSFAWEQIRLSPMAKEAAREGWIHMLFWFLVAKGRLPDTDGSKPTNKGELAKLKKAAFEHEQDFIPSILRKDNPLKILPDHQKLFAKWVNDIEDRKEELCKTALGENWNR